MGENRPQSLIFSRFEIFEPPLFLLQIRMGISSKLALRTLTNTHVLRYALCKIIMAEDICNIRISSCFMHFDGVTEQLCKVTCQRLKKFLECRSKWAKLNCQQAEIAKKSYENINDGSVISYMDTNPDSINLEWYHHMKCWKRFCDEEKIRRQQRKEEKGEGSSSKGPTSAQESLVEMEPIEPRRKITRQSVVEAKTETLLQRNPHVLPEICIICGRDASWFSTDKV